MLRRRLLPGCILGCALTCLSSGLSAEPVPKTAAPVQSKTAPVDRDDQDSPDDEPERPARKPRAVTAEQSTATHQQVRIIKPLHDGKPVTLATYCLAADGNLLACVDTNGADPAAAEAESGERKPAERPPQPPLPKGGKEFTSFVQVYSPEGKLVEETPVPFNATAINVGADGTVFIAGEGKLAKIVNGKVADVTSTPHIGDYEEFKKKVIASAKEEVAEFCKDFKDQIKEIQKQIDAIESRGKQKELTKRDQAKLTSLKQSLDVQTAQLMAFDRTDNEDELVRERLVVTALGVTDRDVFVSVLSVEGHGYEVWRTNHDFQEPKKVVTQLSGCCGQLDIQARGDKLFVAENGKFEVSIRDREGKRLAGFGRRDRSAVDGFGSCCNPMNLRCCSNGDILAAESSIGNIKRFNAKGEFVGLVGKAKIGVGCKHVALALDETRNRYYMMNVDKSHIAVLVPLAEVPVETDAEKALRSARDSFSKRLAGRWARVGVEPGKKPKGGVAGLIGSLVGSDQDEEMNIMGDPFHQITFAPEGKLVAEGGFFSHYFDNDGTWEAVELDGKILEVAFLSGGAEFVSARVEMLSDDELKIRVQNYGSEAYGEPFTCRRDKAPKATKTIKKVR